MRFCHSKFHIHAAGWLVAVASLCGFTPAGFTPAVIAQNSVPDSLQFGIEVPADVEQITGKALKYLADSQNEQGTWHGGYDSHGKGRANCGVAGLAMMAMLSTGEDPNSGPYSANIRAALRYIITTQNPETGFLPNTMYNHGFAMLALAEAYGAVDDALIWENVDDVDVERKRTVGEALRLAVQLAVKSQNQNVANAWRYLPTSQDSDTSVSGAMLVGLLAARNAGVAVPDENIENAIQFLKLMTSSKSGRTTYTTEMDSISEGSSLSAIAALTMAISQNRELKGYESARTRIKKYIQLTDQSFPYYNMYYMAQALFQTDYEAWERWNRITIRRLRRQQKPDGSFDSQHGVAYGTTMACLSLALNYRFLPIYER